MKANFFMIFNHLNAVTIILISYLLILNGVVCELNLDNAVSSNKDFKSVPTTIKTFENDTVLLPCYHNSPYRYVRWHKDDVLLIDSRQMNDSQLERINLWPNGSLQVSNLKYEDTGEYYCEIMMTSGHAVQMHAIEVQYPPTIVSMPSGVVEVPVGSVFEIVCEAKGVPHPIITWRRNGVDIYSGIPENKRRMLVEVESKEMSGPIECIASNGVGEPSIAGIHLNVLFKPEVKAVTNTVHTKINLRAHLECHVIAAPAATVHWFHHGVPIIPDLRVARHDVEIQSNRSLMHYYTESKHTLVVKKVKDHDLGMYECRAENKIGYKGVIIELTGRPVACTFKTPPTVSTSTTHNLIWQTESLSPIIEYKLKFRQISSSSAEHITPPQNSKQTMKNMWNELTIPAELSEGPIHTAGYSLRGLQPASIYEAIVLSRNRYGWSDSSRIIRFTTTGEVELPNYSTESPTEVEYDEYYEISSNFSTLSVLRNENRTSKSSSLSYSNTINQNSLIIFIIIIIVSTICTIENTV